jgi:hypothetical protein
LSNNDKKGVTMRNKLEPYKRFVFIGIIAIALGVTFSTTLKESVGSLGTVFIAVGGLFLIIGMSKKRKEYERKNKQRTHNKK